MTLHVIKPFSVIELTSRSNHIPWGKCIRQRH